MEYLINIANILLIFKKYSQLIGTHLYYIITYSYNMISLFF